MIATVASPGAKSAAVEIEPDTTRNSICPLPPKIARSDCSNSESAVSTATLVPFAAPDTLVIDLSVS